MKARMTYLNELVMTGLVFTFLSLPVLFGPRSTKAESVTPSPSPTTTVTAPIASPGSSPDQTPEAKSAESKSVNPEVQAEVEKKTAEKRQQLMKDAVAAVEETHNALSALDGEKKDEALAALERVTGKLDLIVAREPALALAPVHVATIIRDLYSNVETVNAMVKEAKKYLDEGKVQQARMILGGVASEAELQVTNIPLASYPTAIKAVAPLIDAGKIAEAKTALQTALNTLVIESFIVPLPRVRAEAMLIEAEKLAEKANRSEEENKKLKELMESSRHELQLGEALGYGNKTDYKPLYAQLDEIQTKTEGGKSGKGYFDKIKGSLANLKDQVQGKK